MCKKNIYLAIISIFAFVLSFFIPYFLNENSASFPAPVLTNNKAEDIYQDFSKIIYETSDSADKPSIQLTSNYNVGKFLSDHNYSQDQVDVLAKKIPLYNVTVSGSYTLGIDPLTKDINLIINGYCYYIQSALGWELLFLRKWLPVFISIRYFVKFLL